MAGLNLKAHLSLDGSGFQTGLARADRSVNRFASSTLKSLKGQLAAVFTIGAFAEISRRTLEWAGNLQDLADRLSVNVEYLQEMSFILKQTGAKMEDLIGFTEKLGKVRYTILQETKQGKQREDVMAQNFGTTREDWSSGGSQTIIDKIALAFEKGNSQQLVAALGSIGVKGAGAMSVAFGEGLVQGRAAARAAGAVASEDVINQLDIVGDQLSALADMLMVKFAPALVMVGRLILDTANKIGIVVKAFPALIAEMTIGILKNLPGVVAPAVATLLRMTSGGNKERNQGEIFAAVIGTPNLNDDFDAMVAKAKAGRKARVARPDWNVAPIEGKPEKIKDAKFEKSDSLISVGNFLGASRSAIESIGEETNRLLREGNKLQKQIVDKIDNLADNMPGFDGFPD